MKESPRVYFSSFDNVLRGLSTLQITKNYLLKHWVKATFTLGLSNVSHVARWLSW